MDYTLIQLPEGNLGSFLKIMNVFSHKTLLKADICGNDSDVWE